MVMDILRLYNIAYYIILLLTSDYITLFFIFIIPSVCVCVCVRVSPRKKMFYLTMNSAYFIYSYMCLTYGIMVNVHSDSEKRNMLPLLHGLTLFD